ncbi:MAG: hypothetical protein ACREEA_06875, partial [Stellaceae bacterium]
FSGASASSQNTVPTPNPGRPAQDQVTYVQVQYECATQNPDLVFEKTESGGEVAGNQQVGNDGLPWGVQANTDAYELPCTDQTNSIVTPPPVPNGNLDSQSWQNGNQNAVPLPQ